MCNHCEAEQELEIIKDDWGFIPAVTVHAKGGKGYLSVFGEIVGDYGDLVDRVAIFNVNFCPMCGRRLGGDAS